MLLFGCGIERKEQNGKTMSAERLTNAGVLGTELFERGDVGVFTFDREGNVLRANPAMVRLLGSPDEKTTRLFNIFALPTVPRRVKENFVRPALADGQIRTAEFEYVSMHGKRADYRATFLPVVDDGQVTGCICQVVDITDLRQATDQLRRTSKMASLSLLAGSLAHDLNNIFTTLLGFASILEAGDETIEPEKRTRALGFIRKAATSGGNLVEQLLGFTSERRAADSCCALNRALQQAVTLFSYGVPQEVEVSLDSELPSVWVEGSCTRFEQIVLNVLLNARDAIGKHPGRISISAELHPESPEGVSPKVDSPAEGFVKIVIEDTGSGMSPDVIARVFDPYFTTKEHGRGTGLGLSSVWGILKEVGGGARVTSTAGEGTRFEVFVPVADRKVVPAEERAPVLGSHRGKGERVLVVESAPEIRELLVWILLKNGYKAIAAESCARASDILRAMAETIQCVVFEADLPVAESEELLLTLADLEMPTLHVTGIARPLPRTSHTLGLRKPFTPGRFLMALGRLLAASPGNPEK
jgi:two-component system, cell cycle sensor histidine kinase and response regulator CckA